MEYVYSAMLLHVAKKKIDEKSVTDILKAAGIDVDSGRVKALVASLKDIDIEEAIKSASVMPVAAPAAESPAKAEKKEEEEGKTEEEAAAGLGALFG